MRFLLPMLVSVSALLANEPVKPALLQIRTVYLLPMSNSMDQYLANQISATGLFLVVTDPLKAEAIVTDSIGKSFETKLEELYPKPKKETHTQAEKDKQAEDDRAKPADRIGSFSRGRGNVFIIDRGSHSVLWSIYLPVRSSTPEDTHRRAADIVKHLGKDIKAWQSVASPQPSRGNSPSTVQ